MTRQVRRIAFYGYLGSGNLGNDASLETVLHWWRTHHPEIELHCITIAPEAVRERYGVSAEPLAWRSRRDSRYPVGRVLQRLVGRGLDLVRTFRLAGSGDAIIVPGMGVLESSLGTRPWGMPAWLFGLAIACRMRGRRFLLLDVGADVADSRATRWLTGRTVAAAAHVSYRDQESADAMATLTTRRPDAVAPDLAFAHPASREIRPEPGRLVLGVMAFYGPSDDPVVGAAIHDRYLTALADGIGILIRDGMQVVLVNGDGVDDKVAEEVLARCRRLDPRLSPEAVQVRRCRTFLELTEEMARAEIVAGSRFHNVIAALRIGRPTIAIGYAPKSRHLMEAMVGGSYSVDLVELDADRLVSLVRRARAHRDDLVELIGRSAAGASESVESLLQEVGEDLLGPAETVRPGVIPEVAR